MLHREIKSFYKKKNTISFLSSFKNGNGEVINDNHIDIFTPDQINDFISFCNTNNITTYINQGVSHFREQGFDV